MVLEISPAPSNPLKLPRCLASGCLLFFAALLWLMAGVVGEGLVLADENASFV